NLSLFIEAFDSSPGRITREDRCLQMYELTFDLSISSYLPPLLNGACVYTVPNGEVKYMQVLRITSEYRLTSIQIVPSIIKLAKPLLKRISLPAVRNCIMGGEATQIDLLTSWRTCIPNAAIYNYYGPTESTIYCSWMEYPAGCRKQYNGMIAIGKAMNGTTLLIVGDKDEELPAGEKGELLIGGRQLTPGYVKNEEKNRASFLEKTIAGRKMRFYRSGDMCYKDEEGDIFYCGRFDNQVKIQGFRVELSEIEFLVRGRFEINNVVIVSETEQGATRLVLVLEKEGKEDVGTVLTYLKDKLPEYMVPARVTIMDEFPLNTSGKIDRKRIKEMLNGSA
ncbi:MAG TPA: AMP-binding protein, partial [Puia sp.]|nr:AMP-binding protein [Puia sp.]